MSAFPAMKTGAVMQFPAVRTLQFSTDIVQFMDGTEQRYRDYGLPYHRWIVQLGALDEGELQRVRIFIQQMNGAAGVFSFTDPWDGAVYPECSLEGTVFADLLAEPMHSGIKVTIRENRA